MAFPERVEGETAVFERWSHERHGATLRALNENPEVNRTLGGRQAPARLDALSRGIATHWEEHGFGLWAVIVGGVCVGFSGACHPSANWPDELQREIELGWRLDSRAWGRGHATEGARHAIAALPRRDRLIAFVADGNERSIAVTRRLGMEPNGETRGGHPPTTVRIYELR